MRPAANYGEKVIRHAGLGAYWYIECTQRPIRFTFRSVVRFWNTSEIWKSIL